MTDDTEVVIKGGKNPEQTGRGQLLTGRRGAEVEKQKPVVDAEPGAPAENTGTELVVWPEDAKSGEAQEKDDPEPADGEPKTPDTQKPVGKTAAATLRHRPGRSL